MERSPKRADALLLQWSASLADRRPRPARPLTRYAYQRKVARALELAREGGHSLFTGDVRVVRYVLGKISPHPSTQNGYMSALRSFYDYMVERGLRKDNPAKQIGRPPHIKTAPRPLHRDDCVAYLQAAERLGIQFYALGCLGLYEGFRREEIRSRRWVDFFPGADGRIWCDVEGKGGRRGRVPVHPRVQAMLPRLRASHNDPVWLFPSPRNLGQPLSVGMFDKRHNQIVAEASIPTCTLHALRHTYATHMRMNGADISVVQKGLRHSDIASTMIYAAVLDSELASAVETLDFEARVGEC